MVPPGGDEGREWRARAQEEEKHYRKGDLKRSLEIRECGLRSGRRGNRGCRDVSKGET